MTRINLVPVGELTRRHLVAEYRELPRIFALMHRWQVRGGLPSIPSRFALGTGHMTFFVDKALWLLSRQAELVAEMLRRGYHPRYTDPYMLATGLDGRFMNDWSPTEDDVALSRSRMERRKMEGHG